MKTISKIPPTPLCKGGQVKNSPLCKRGARGDLKITLILLFVFLLSCNGNPNHKKFSGTLEFTEHGVGARVAGRMTSLKVDEGDEVKTGQLIATLERYDQNKRDYERQLALSRQGGATQQSVEQAKLTLEDQEITSPVDGVILTKVHEIGEVLAAGSAAVVIGDRAKVWVKIYVPEGIVSRLQLKQPAQIKFDGLNRLFKGHIYFIAPQAEFTPRNVQTEEERITQTFAVKVKLDEMEPYLRPGVNADVFLDVKDPSVK